MALRRIPIRRSLHRYSMVFGAERELALGYRHMQRHTVEHGLDVRRHVVWPFDIVDPGRIFRHQVIEATAASVRGSPRQA